MRAMVLLLGTLICFDAAAEVDWRLSDSLGTNRGPAAEGQKSGWLLRVEPGAGVEERTLFHDGREDSVRRVHLDPAGRVVRVEEFRDGLRLWDVAYDPETGLPTEEVTFEDGRAVETAKLQFQDRVMVKRTVYSDPRTILYTDTLGRWPDGTLRRLERDGPQGPLAEVEWSYGPGGTLTGSWLVEAQAKALGQHRETVYGNGKTVETLASGTQVLLTRVTEELQSGSLETETDPEAQRVDRRTLDNQGRPTEEVVLVKGAVTQSRRWVYDAKGRLVEASTEAAGPREVWTFTYADDGTVSNRLTRGGTLIREETLVGGVKTRVRLYDRGALFLVEDWTGGKLTRETYYQNGEVVRERTP